MNFYILIDVSLSPVNQRLQYSYNKNRNIVSLSTQLEININTEREILNGEETEEEN